MKAIVINHYGDVSVLKASNGDIPRIKPNKPLIKGTAAGINRKDIAQRKEHYPTRAGTAGHFGAGGFR